jgi:hypothetical protein
MGDGKEVRPDGTASTLFDLESWWHWHSAPGWLPRKVCGEHGRIVIFGALTQYVRG